MSERDTEVLIVGGGLVGLAAALFLAWHEVPAVLVEQHAGISPHPRARGVNPRTMELLRAVGLEERLRATDSARALAGNSGIVAVESLAGKEIGRLVQPYHMDGGADFGPFSPTTWCVCHQDVVEPILREHAEGLGADIRFGVRLTGFEQDADGVRAAVEERDGGAGRTLRARYLIAADGAAGGIRERLGIGAHGAGTLGHFLNIQFEADLRAELGDRRFVICYTMAGGRRAALLPIDNARRWLLHVPFDPAEIADYTPERCAELVRLAAGVPGLDVAVQGAVPWESAGRVADRFRDGRVFLAGDAAHVMPPSGAYGSNTGIHDVHNLAWRLAAVLRGDAGEALLDGYDAERRPAAEHIVDQAVRRSRDRPRIAVPGGATGQAPDPAIETDATVMFGVRQRSAAVLAEPDGGDDDGGPWEKPLSGRPGSRAPHVWLRAGDGRRVSTVDLVGGRGFVLLCGADGEDWAKAAADLGVAAHRIVPPGAGGAAGPGTLTDASGGWPSAYGTGTAGAVLVRPDGYVCWRARAAAADPRGELERALGRILERS